MFELSLEIIHVPGHTPGSCCILIPEERVILFGDACNINTLILWGVTIGQCHRELERLKTFESRYDKVL